MHSFQPVYVTLMFLIFGLLGLAIALAISQAFMKKKVSIAPLFIGLRQKLFMTSVLGLFFLCLYAFVVLAASYVLNTEMRLAIFNAMRNNPIYFAYLGLTFFIIISLSILLVRRVIKRFYNSR